MTRPTTRRPTPCVACHEPSTHGTDLKGRFVCTACMERLKARARHMQARTRRPADEIREAHKNSTGDRRRDGGAFTGH